MLVGTVSTLINLAYLRLGAVPEAREAADLGEARVAIDAIAALAPVVTRIAPPQLGSELRETLARLQLAYAELAEGPGSADPPAAVRLPRRRRRRRNRHRGRASGRREGKCDRAGLVVRPATLTGVRALSPHRRGVLFVAAAAIAWSSAGVLTRSISAPAATQLFWRAFFAALCLFALVLAQSHGRPLQPFRSLGAAGVGVAVCFATASSAFMLALGETTVARVLFIQAVAPFLAAALAFVVLRERVPARTAVAMAAALGGVVVMIGGSVGGGHLLGDGLALLMALAFSGAIVLTRLRRDVLMTPATCLAMVLASVASAVTADDLAVSPSDLVQLALFGAGQMCLGLALFAVGARLIPAGEAGLITLVEVVLGPAWVWATFGERPDRATLVGGTIVVGAVVAHALADLADDRASRGSGSAPSGSR